MHTVHCTGWPILGFWVFGFLGLNLMIFFVVFVVFVVFRLIILINYTLNNVNSNIYILHYVTNSRF